MGIYPGKEKRMTTNADYYHKRKHELLLLLSVARKRPQQEVLSGTDDRNYNPSSTKLHDLPLEMLDVILQKCYLHWTLHSSANQKDEEIIRSLISVDVCFYRRLTRRRLKSTIWRYLEAFYRKSAAERSVIRHNRKYLIESIQPTDRFIDSLLDLNCLTEEEVRFIKRLRLDREKNEELLCAMRPFDEEKFSKFIRCLRRTNQKTASRVIRTGGVLVKSKQGSREAESLFVNRMQDEEGLEILKTHRNNHTVIWIWCKSQEELQKLKKLVESNGFEDCNIDHNQFLKEIVLFPSFFNLFRRIDIEEDEAVWGVAKLRHKIHVLCYSSSSSSPNLIRVFDDQSPFLLRKNINIEEIKEPWNIICSEVENCLYVSDPRESCVWKIAIEADDDQHEIINRWLTTDNHEPQGLSMSIDRNHLIIVSYYSSVLRIYGSDSELLRSVQLPRDIKNPIHAVETSIGTFIVLHRWLEKKTEEEGGNGLTWLRREMKWDIREVTSDGRMVIRRFIPANEGQNLRNPDYLSFDSEGQVFVADSANHRVILLNSDLRWNRIICPTTEEEEEDEEETRKIESPNRLCFDEKKKQLIVGCFGGIHIYTTYQ